MESVLLEHECVVESAVVGSRHAVKGFVVKAFIVLSAGYAPDEQIAKEIFAFAKKNLAAYKTPRIIEFVTELPKTISGKIRRIELRASEEQKIIQHLKGDHEYYF
ncbi:AMP-binding enzyme [Ginsengibacter hankyongi]|uniref:AMP-binding enzyme n=1 Tax=Ginsengibacter hankyongi TaxID=2607284 RepID=UPI00374277DB